MTEAAIVMVAPTGARKTRRDHGALPIAIGDTVAEAAACHAAGASVLHAHVRGDADEHVLDAGLYRELIAEMASQVPEMLVQITSEAVGRYSPRQQIECLQSVKPRMASMCLREITADFSDSETAREFFSWCVDENVHVQHIVFSAAELGQFFRYRELGIIPDSQRCLMFVLGRYNENFQSDPAELDPFLQYDLAGFDWFTCAFGRREQDCVMRAIAAGGHARVGFENNLYLPDGELAPNTAALVSSLVESMHARAIAPATGEQARQALGVRRA